MLADIEPTNNLPIDQHKQFDDLFENCECPFDAWDSKTASHLMITEYTDWLIRSADWSSFITLTFRDPIGYDPAYNKFRYLNQVLNRELFGKRYTRIVKHSYFSYILCAEYQCRDVLHFHLLVDRPVDFALIHNTWGNMAGFVQTKKIRNPFAAVRYAIKYVIKEGDIRIYQAKALYQPRQYPIWWKFTPEETI